MPVLYYVWYRSYTPDGKLWCSTDDSVFFLEYNARWDGEGHLTSKKIVTTRQIEFPPN